MHDSKNHEAEKKQFAKLMTEGLDENRAAFEVFPKDPANRMKASIQWSKDSEVIAFTKEILGISEPEKTLPTKEEHIGELYEIFRDDEIGVKDRLVASEQISRIQGFIQEKKEQNTTINNRVIVVAKSGSMEDWEKGIRQQQQQLVEKTIEIKQIDDVEENDDSE